MKQDKTLQQLHFLHPCTFAEAASGNVCSETERSGGNGIQCTALHLSPGAQQACFILPVQILLLAPQVDTDALKPGEVKERPHTAQRWHSSSGLLQKCLLLETRFLLLGLQVEIDALQPGGVKERAYTALRF